MKQLPRWVKGFFRLYVVLCVIALIAWHVFEAREFGKWTTLLIDRHLAPIAPLGFSPMLSDWCVIIATEEFLAKSHAEKVKIAKEFFREHIEANYYMNYIDAENFKKKFLKTATLSLQDAPIEAWSDGTRYRDLSKHADYGMHVFKVMFSTEVILSALISAFVITLFLMLVFLTIRWIYQGFRA